MVTGEACPDPDCKGTMRTNGTKVKGFLKVRRLKCDHCGATGKEIHHLDALGRIIPKGPAAGIGISNSSIDGGKIQS